MIYIKLWIDDLREAPEGYVWYKSVNEAKYYILAYENLIRAYKNELAHPEIFERMGLTLIPENYEKLIKTHEIEFIDLDHDAGDYVCDGGDYIKLLDWLEETGRSYPIHIHSQNPVGVENMRRIIERNGWREVK